MAAARALLWIGVTSVIGEFVVRFLFLFCFFLANVVGVFAVGFFFARGPGVGRRVGGLAEASGDSFDALALLRPPFTFCSLSLSLVLSPQRPLLGVFFCAVVAVSNRFGAAIA